MVTLVESSAAATQPLVEPRKKAEAVPVLAALAHKTWVQDWPPLVVLQMALSLNTQSLVKNTAPAFCAQPISRSIMWIESNSGAGGSCASFETISPRATFEQASKTPLKMSARQMTHNCAMQQRMTGIQGTIFNRTAVQVAPPSEVL